VKLYWGQGAVVRVRRWHNPNAPLEVGKVVDLETGADADHIPVRVSVQRVAMWYGWQDLAAP
jgi:hypothetical protein